MPVWNPRLWLTVTAVFKKKHTLTNEPTVRLYKHTSEFWDQSCAQRKHTLGSQMMEVQEWGDVAVYFAFAPRVSCSVKRSWPRQEMNEIHHMFKWLTVCKFRPEGVEMWLVPRTRPKLKFIAPGRWPCEDSHCSHTHSFLWQSQYSVWYRWPVIQLPLCIPL